MAEEYRLLSVEQALEMVLAQVQPLGPENTPLLEALGRVLAEDVYADTDIPPLNNSAMDGYALRAADLASARPDAPVILRVLYNLAAGYTSDRAVTPGHAVRIMTGAPIPPGADTVVPFEETEVAGDQVQLARPQRAGHNVRRAGEDVRRGALILPEGSEIRPQEVGMLAALGRSTLWTRRRPRVGILATGDEVVEIDTPLTPGKIRNTNSYSNAAQVLAYGGIPVLLGIARDAEDAVAARVRVGLAQGLDFLLTSGGISVGDFDVVKRVLATEGEIGFWQVRMRPGKPLAFGKIGDGRTSPAVPLLGLPGNPVAAMVSCALFARPAILKMLGQRDWSAPIVPATMLEDVPGKSGFRYYLRVTLQKREGQYFARLTGEQGSGILLSMVKAQGLAIMPEDQAGLQAGQTVQVMLF